MLALSLFFNALAHTEIYTLSLHDALPIFLYPSPYRASVFRCRSDRWRGSAGGSADARRDGLSRALRNYGERVTTHRDRKSTRLNSSHTVISYAVFCLKKKITHHQPPTTST